MNKKLGQRCAEYRRGLGVTQQQIADELDYTVYNVSAFENGRNRNSKILAWYLNHGMKWEDEPWQ